MTAFSCDSLFSDVCNETAINSFQMVSIGNFLIGENESEVESLRFERTKSEIHWNTPGNSTPRDVPDCGFDGICPTNSTPTNLNPQSRKWKRSSNHGTKLGFDRHHGTGTLFCRAVTLSQRLLHNSWQIQGTFDSSFSLPRLTKFNFFCSLTSNITPHCMKNLAFHSLLKLKDENCHNSLHLTSPHTFLFNGRKNVLFELGIERVKRQDLAKKLNT